MRIRNRQVRLPLSLLSPVPISDLKTTFTVPAAVLEQQQQQQEVVQLHQQPPSSSTQQAAAEHVDQNYPQLVAPAAPLVSTAHDQSDQPTYQHHDEETTHGDPSDLRQKEGGRMITVEDQKVFDGEPVDHQVDNHDHDHGRKLRQEILNKSHVRTKCCTNSTSSKQQGRSDAAAKSSESSGILAADNKLFLINPHCSSTPQGARTLAGQQMPAVGCDGYPWCCQEEKSIPLKKRRGSCCPTIAPPCIAESDYHDNHQKVEDSGDNKKKQKNSIAILCKTNQKGTRGLKFLLLLLMLQLFLLFLSFSLAVEALHAFIQDESEHKHYLIVSAVTNLLVNLIGVWFFRGYARINLVYRNAEDMNCHSICLHVLADSIRSAGLILASWCLSLGIQNAEVLCLGLVSVMVFMLVMPLFKATGDILLQSAPPSITSSAMTKCCRQVAALEDVSEVSDARFWELVPGRVVGSLSLMVKPGIDDRPILQFVHGLYHDIGVQDLAVQIEYS